jgi:hypothetical protein
LSTSLGFLGRETEETFIILASLFGSLALRAAVELYGIVSFTVIRNETIPIHEEDAPVEAPVAVGIVACELGLPHATGRSDRLNVRAI